MMKSRFYVYLICATVSIAVSCTVSVPNKIAVTASPTVAAGLGTKSFALSDHLSKDDIKNMFGADDGASVVEHRMPNAAVDAATELMVHYPLAEMPIDLSAYLESVDFDAEFSSGMNQSVHIPDITFSGSPTIDCPAVFSALPHINNIPVTVPMVFTIPSNTISSPSTETQFVSAVISSGSITVTIDLPGVWEHVTKQLELTILQPGGLNIHDTYNEQPSCPNTFVIPLDNETLGADLSSITINGTFTITPDSSGGTVSLPAGATNVTVRVNGVVNSFAQITVPPEVLKPVITVNQNIALPEAFSKWISAIRFDNANPLALTVTLNNGMPAGTVSNDNALSIDVVSHALYINDRKSFAAASKTTATYEALSPDNTLRPSSLPVNAVGCSEFDLGVSVILPVDAAGNVCLKNVSADADIVLNLELGLKSEWISADIDASAVDKVSGFFPSNGSSIDLSKVYEFFPDGTNFKSVKTYVYVGGLGDNVELEGFVNAYVNEVEQSLFGSSASPEEIDMLPEMPEFLNTLKTAEVYTGAIAEPSMTLDLTNLINSRPVSLSLQYSIGIKDSVTIQRSDIVHPEAATLKANMLILLPFKVTVLGIDTIGESADKGLKINFDDSGKTKTDMLGRDNPGSSDDEVSEYFDYISDGTVTINITNNSLGMKNITGYFTIGSVYKTFDLSEAHTIELTSDDISYIKTNAFIPEFGLFLKNTETEETIGFNLDGKLDITATGVLNTSIDKTISF